MDACIRHLIVYIMQNTKLQPKVASTMYIIRLHAPKDRKMVSTAHALQPQTGQV
jgi:hypothetical protein